MPATKGTGTTISQGPIGTPVLIGELTNISMPDGSADSIETTTLDVADGYKTFTAGLKDAGEVTVEGNFDPSDAGQEAMQTSFNSGSTDPYTVTFPASIGKTFSFNAFITKLTTGGAADLKDVLKFKATLKITGKPTLA